MQHSGSRGAGEVLSRLGRLPNCDTQDRGPIVGIVIRCIEATGRETAAAAKDGEGQKTCTKRKLLSLIGQLQHACCVVRPWQSFLCQMIVLPLPDDCPSSAR